MEEIDQAIKILKKGGIVIYPTDTAFAIGCRIDYSDTIKKLFKIRKRPINQATPVLVSSFEMAESLYSPSLSKNVRRLMELYWPGALTIVYFLRKMPISSLVTGGQNKIGLRMPNHKIALQLISGVGVPLLGPSANFHGEATPYEFNKLDSKLVNLVDYVVEGKCQIKNVSTVIDCTVSPWKIIRQGAVRIPENLMDNEKD